MEKNVVKLILNGQKVVVSAENNSEYLILNQEGSSPKKVFLKKIDDDLEIYSDEAQVEPDVIIEDYYAEGMDLEVSGVDASSQEVFNYEIPSVMEANGEFVTSTMADSSISYTAATLGALGLGGVAAAAGGGSSGGSSSSDGGSSGGSSSTNNITGSVVAGPVVAGHDLVVTAYDLDGNILGETSLDDNGEYSLDMGSHSGVVLLRVSDEDETTPDYVDETTGNPVDLSGVFLASTVIGDTETNIVNITPISTIASIKAGFNTDGTSNGSVTEEGVISSNKSVAKDYGLNSESDTALVGETIIATVDTGGNSTINDANSDVSANYYGHVLAAFSAAGNNLGISVDELISHASSSSTDGTNGEDTEAVILEKVTEHILESISQITNTDNEALNELLNDTYISTPKMVSHTENLTASVVGLTEGEEVTLRLKDGDTIVAEVKEVVSLVEGKLVLEFESANWSQDLDSIADGNYSFEYIVDGEVIISGDSFNKDVELPSPLIASLTEDTGSADDDSITNNGEVTVSGIIPAATWKYSINGGNSWEDGVGTSFTLGEGQYDDGNILVKQITLNQVESVVTNLGAITVDKTASDPLGVSLSEDTGSVTDDGITNNGEITISGLDSSATWEYSTDSGNSWTTGSGTTFSLAEGNYSDGTVQVRQTDPAGNISTATNLGAVTIDLSVAQLSASFSDTGSSSSDGITNSGTVTISGLETGAMWQYDIGNGWQDGSGNSFELAPGTYTADQVKVKQIDEAGNESAEVSLGAITVDTQVDPLSLSLENTTVTISGLESGATWEYSLDAGQSWTSGSGDSFAIDSGTTYADGDVLARQTDVAGNTGTPATYQSVASISNLDVRSDIVMDFDGTLSGVIKIVSDTGNSFYINTDDSNKTYSDAAMIDEITTSTVSQNGGKLTIDLGNDLDLSTDYIVTVNEGQDSESILNISTIDPTQATTLSNVTYGSSNITALSVKYDTDGTVIDSDYWLNLDGLMTDALGDGVSIDGTDISLMMVATDLNTSNGVYDFPLGAQIKKVSLQNLDTGEDQVYLDVKPSSAEPDLTSIERAGTQLELYEDGSGKALVLDHTNQTEYFGNFLGEQNIVIG